MTTLEAFGNNLKTARESLGLSQAKLADLAGINRNYVGSVERGERNVCLRNIVKLAQALEIPPASLLDGI